MKIPLKIVSYCIYHEFYPMRCLIALFFLLSLSISVRAQSAYTQNNYNFYKSDSDLVYGISDNYAGQADTLVMDIYKPLGDLNCLRPVLILVHGGSWIAGTKNDPNIVYIAQEMARKGYVVAAIKYRLGMHKAANYSMYWACNNSISAPCAYIADSSELIRAIYRGMQDAKGAVRFMKARSGADSTDIENVYIAGESAGGFIALSVAFMREEVQKPADCFLLPDAVNPDPDLVFCNPSVTSFSRPDLGAVEGSLHAGTYNSSVKGVANFYGGMIDTALISASVQKPAMYLFHQGSDVVVDYEYNRILGRINWECYAPSNLCQPYPFTPFAFGSEAIRKRLDSTGVAAPLFRADIIYNYNYMNDCFANGHSIDNVSLRTLHMAELFSQVIDSSANDPLQNCNLVSVGEARESSIFIYPNPAHNSVRLEIPENMYIESIDLLELTGRKVMHSEYKGERREIILDVSSVKGVYFLDIKTKNSRLIKKVFIH